MKKNEERILNYLSCLSDSGERIRFEEDLASSEELKKEFEMIHSRIKSIDLAEYPETDERYFAGLIPRVREKLENRKTYFSRKIVYYTAPAAAAIIIISLVLFNPGTDFESQYKELAEAVVDNISDTVVSEKYFTELESRPAEAVLTEREDNYKFQFPAELEVTNDTYARLLDNPIAEEYGTLNRLSDNELEIVYDKLNSNSSQKVTK
ncbi:MAG: hypothetical protein WC061_04630 [Melioribacteraceae bacterium]